MNGKICREDGGKDDEEEESGLKDGGTGRGSFIQNQDQKRGEKLRG